MPLIKKTDASRFFYVCHLRLASTSVVALFAQYLPDIVRYLLFANHRLLAIGLCLCNQISLLGSGADNDMLISKDNYNPYIYFIYNEDWSVLKSTCKIYLLTIKALFIKI
ncbi:hypothetical protein DXX93_08255 [Thalassotalea euphylliae]|uniref:Uncharacterized protein n=1 Tax=Thalassotalea euphylliae TaxID=1655234 RepID=A0A3E0TPZ2_9GAMM|nr:hypothetical protein DXX93_08255 [Thalassotalea euphylliae]